MRVALVKREDEHVMKLCGKIFIRDVIKIGGFAFVRGI